MYYLEDRCLGKSFVVHLSYHVLSVASARRGTAPPMYTVLLLLSPLLCIIRGSTAGLQGLRQGDLALLPLQNIH
jgi:hypothetical protein